MRGRVKENRITFLYLHNVLTYNRQPLNRGYIHCTYMYNEPRLCLFEAGRCTGTELCAGPLFPRLLGHPARTWQLLSASPEQSPGAWGVGSRGPGSTPSERPDSLVEGRGEAELTDVVTCDILLVTMLARCNI